MIQIQDLQLGYGSRVILKNINLSVEENEFLGIIGPNGSGKTTLIRAITRIIKPQNGRVVIDGEDINQIGFRDLAKKVAVASQGFDTQFDITVKDYVLLGRIPHRAPFQFLETNKDKEAVDQAMDLTEVRPFKDRILGELSAGERQLVFIARALAQEPKFLFLDEPTSHLDIAHQVKILDLIRRINRENKITVLIILHDLNLAGEYCDRLMLMHAGYIHTVGRPQEVLTYQNIEEVYQTVVVVENNPISLKPYIVLVSEEEKEKRRK